MINLIVRSNYQKVRLMIIIAILPGISFDVSAQHKDKLLFGYARLPGVDYSPYVVK